jgi:hypothetical protein
MKIWFSAALWLAIVALHSWVVRRTGTVICGLGSSDSGGPLWLVTMRDNEAAISALLMLSPMILMPLGKRWSAQGRKDQVSWIEVGAAFLAGLSLVFQPVDPRTPFANDPTLQRIIPAGFLFALPWMALRLLAAGTVVRKWCSNGFGDHQDVCLAVAQLFPAIGAAWLVAHRANWTPWNFDPLIVLLTAAHFHHAGFTLPLMAGLNAEASPGCWTRFSCVAILVGVPLVAVGITCTHFGVLRFVEPFGVTVLVLGALGVAVSQIRRGVQIRSGLGFWTRTAFVVSGGSLLSAMILAMGFGLRHVVPDWALTMPQMWMIHGTLNAFGFGLCGVLAWRAGPESVRTKVA